MSTPGKSVSENPKAGPRAHILSVFSCGQEVELSTSQEDSWLVTSPGPPAGKWQSQDLNSSRLATRAVQWALCYAAPVQDDACKCSTWHVAATQPVMLPSPRPSRRPSMPCSKSPSSRKTAGIDHFTTCTNTESSCCTPETNIILYVSFIQIFLEVCATEGTIKKWKDSLQDGRKYVQTIHLIRVQNILKLSQLNSKKRNDSITKWIKDLNRQKKVYR